VSVTVRGHRREAFAAAALCGALLAACGGGDGDANGDGSPAAVPKGSVAVVGEERVTQPELRRRIAAVSRASSGGEQAPSREALRSQALTLLVQQAALEQEAAKLGVTVRPAEVRERLAKARRQFDSRAEFRRFLGRQTVADLLFQLRLQMLGERVTEAAERNGEDPKRYGARLLERWADQTACARGLDASGCPSGDAKQ
jgi:hypothetical protein